MGDWAGFARWQKTLTQTQVYITNLTTLLPVGTFKCCYVTAISAVFDIVTLSVSMFHFPRLCGVLLVCEAENHQTCVCAM